MYIIAWLNLRDWRGCGGAAGAGLAGTPGAGDGPTTTLIRAACAWATTDARVPAHSTLASATQAPQHIQGWQLLIARCVNREARTSHDRANSILRKRNLYEFYMTLVPGECALVSFEHC